MVSASPWSVKGVDPEAREAAKIAARRAGMTLGQWLNQTIRRTAAEQLAGPVVSSREIAPYDPARYDPAMNAGHDGGADDTDAPANGSAMRAHPPAPTTEAIFESIRRLATRVEETETRTKATVEPLASRVAQLSEQVEQVKAQSARSTAPVERAILRISERLAKIETPGKPVNGSRGWSLFGRGG
jgi:localization factor PodJL